MKRLLLLLGIGAVGLSGAGAAALVSLPEQADPRAQEAVAEVLTGGGGAPQDGSGVHGGPIERLHGSSCGLASGLPGNWTHGDYVSSVAEGGDSKLVPQAARSDCGKPMPAVAHGGPPEHALEHAANGLETAAVHIPAGGPVGS